MNYELRIDTLRNVMEKQPIKSTFGITFCLKYEEFVIRNS